MRETVLARLRRKMGLSAPQMLKAIGAKPSHRSLLKGYYDVDPIFIQQANALYDDYCDWKRWVLSQWSEPGVQKPTRELAQIMDLGEWNVLQLIARGSMVPANYRADATIHQHVRQHLFDLASIERMFHLNEACLSEDVSDANLSRRGPLAAPFLSWRHRTGRDTARRNATFLVEPIRSTSATWASDLPPLIASTPIASTPESDASTNDLPAVGQRRRGRPPGRTASASGTASRTPART